MEPEKAVDEGGCQISGSQGGFKTPGRGAGLLANAESSSAIPGVAVIVILVWDVA